MKLWWRNTLNLQRLSSLRRFLDIREFLNFPYPIKLKYLLLCFVFFLPSFVSAKSNLSLVPRIEAYSAFYGADTLLAVNIAYAESGLNPKARSSSSTATGIFQFTKATWEGNCTPDFSDATDPELNIECGVRLISKKQFFRWETSARMNGHGWLFLPYNKWLEGDW